MILVTTRTDDCVPRDITTETGVVFRQVCTVHGWKWSENKAVCDAVLNIVTELGEIVAITFMED